MKIFSFIRYIWDNQAEKSSKFWFIFFFYNWGVMHDIISNNFYAMKKVFIWWIVAIFLANIMGFSTFAFEKK